MRFLALAMTLCLASGAFVFADPVKTLPDQKVSSVTPKEDRWQEVSEEKNSKIYLDKSTIEKEVLDKSAPFQIKYTCWIKQVDAKGSISKLQANFWYPTRRYQALVNGEESGQPIRPVPPDSPTENIYNFLSEDGEKTLSYFADKEDQERKQQEQQQLEAQRQQEEQQRQAQEEQEKADQKQKVLNGMGTGLGLFQSVGSLFH